MKHIFIWIEYKFMRLISRKSEIIAPLIHGIFTVLRINCEAFLVSEGLRIFLLQGNR